MRDNIWVWGERRLEADDVKTSREAKRAREESKQKLKRQMDMLALESVGDVELKKETEGETPSWTKHMQSMYQDFYE